jgi:two-component sensor histidine kinase
MRSLALIKSPIAFNFPSRVMIKGHHRAKAREEQVSLLAREAQHRTKNFLAIVQATVQLAQGTPADLKAAIKGRVRALAGSSMRCSRNLAG